MDKFDEELKKLGITLTSMQKEQFDRYYELLVEWNKVMNLTGITEYDEVNLKHFTDSLTIVRLTDMTKISTLIDVGTGAGFPGIPIKIVFPHIKVVLLDSLNKRLKFLNTVIDELNLESVQTLHGRAEDHARNAEYREKFDLCVSRAVANLSTLSEYCLPFVRKGGFLLSYKGPDAQKEAESASKAIRVLGGRLVRIQPAELSGYDHNIVVIEKIGDTSAKYPRKAGTPVKEPIF